MKWLRLALYGATLPPKVLQSQAELFQGPIEDRSRETHRIDRVHIGATLQQHSAHVQTAQPGRNVQWRFLILYRRSRVK